MAPATVLISYQNARGVVVIPKSVSNSRIESNLRVCPFLFFFLLARKLTSCLPLLQLISLDSDDMDTLNGMAAKGKQQRVNTPLFGWDLVRFVAFLSRSSFY